MDGPCHPLYEYGMIEEFQPVVQVAARTPCGATWSWHNPEGFRARLNFWLIQSGRGVWRTRQQRFDLKPGDCFIQRLWEECWGENPGSKPLVVLWANFILLDGQGRPVDLRSPRLRLPELHRYLREPSFLEELAGRMVGAHERAQHDRAAAWMRAILIEIGARDRELRQPGPSGGHRARIQELCDEIAAHPEAPCSVAQLAARLHLTPGHFTRLFRQVKGLSPRTFILGTRIAAAKSLLCMSDAKIAEIAERLGFNDVFHFSKRFKEQTGLPPSRFRRLG